MQRRADRPICCDIAAHNPSDRARKRFHGKILAKPPAIGREPTRPRFVQARSRYRSSRSLPCRPCRSTCKPLPRTSARKAAGQRKGRTCARDGGTSTSLRTMIPDTSRLFVRNHHIHDANSPSLNCRKSLALGRRQQVENSLIHAARAGAIEWLNANVVGTGVPVLADTLADSAFIAPSDIGIDEAIGTASR